MAAAAVAWSSILELVRRRGTWAFVLAVTAASAAAPWLGASQGSLRSRLQLAVEYGLGMPVFVTALATAVLAARAVAGDVESRRIQLLLTKPASALDVVAGKLAAVLAASTALLVLAFCAFLANVAILEGAAGRFDGRPEDAMRRFFQARSRFSPALPPVDEEAVRAQVARWRAADPRQAGARADQLLETRARKALRCVRLAFGESADFELRGLPPASTGAGDLVVAYRVYSTRVFEAARVELEWAAVSPSSPAAAPVRADARHGAAEEVALRPGAPGPGGALRLSVKNLSSVTIVIDPAEIEALAATGSFAASAGLAFLLLAAQMAFIACAGILASGAFSFPVAALVSLFWLLTGVAAGFLRETFDLYDPGARHGSVLDAVAGWAVAWGEIVLRALPDLTRVDPIDRLGSGRAIGLGEMAWELGRFGLGSAVALLLAAAILRRKELAA